MSILVLSLSSVAAISDDYTTNTCSDTWGASCEGADPALGDYSFDSCAVSSYYTGSGFKVDEVYVNSTIVHQGTEVEITCDFDCYGNTALNDIAISYYNGTGWTVLFEQIAGANGGCVDGNYSATTTVTGLGEQYARCSIKKTGEVASTTYCYDTIFSDNDDVNFTSIGYQVPEISATAAFDITSIEATLGGSFSYEDSLNVSTTWYLDGTPYFSNDYDKGATSSEYDTYNFTTLTPGTTYDYYLELNYTNGTTPQATFPSLTQRYTCSGGSYTNGVTVQAGTNDPAVCQAFCNSIVDTHSLTCCTEKNGNCYGYFGASSAVYDGDASYFAANVTSIDVPVYDTLVSSTKNFTTLTPTIDTDSVGSITKTGATLWADVDLNSYPNGTVYYQLDGVNVTNEFVTSDGLKSEPVTGLTPNTSYSYRACLLYDTTFVCDTPTTFTTLALEDSLFTAYSATLQSPTAISVSSTITVIDYTTDYYVQYRLVLGNITNITYTDIPSSTVVTPITGLTLNTTYDVRACFNTSVGDTCTTWGYLHTGDVPVLTINDPTFTTKNSTTLNWEIQENDVTNISYDILINGSHTYQNTTSLYVTGLEPETNYSYSITALYTSVGFNLNVTESSSVLSYYENDLDDVWDTLFQGSSIAKILLGLVVLLAIIFGGVAVFGRYNLQIGMYGVLILTVVGSVIAKVMGLFSTMLLLLIIIGAVLLAVLKQMFFTGDGQ